MIDLLLYGDALKLHSKIDDGSIDLILTDPPYNISSDIKITRNGGKFGKAKDINLNFGEWDRGIIKPDIWIPLYVPKLKDNGIFISFVGKREAELMMQTLEEHGMFIRHLGAWVKTNPPPQARKVKWANGLEFFVIATKNKGTGHHYNYKEGHHPDYIISPICMGKERYNHPTQKPERVAYDLIKWWSYPGDLVLDPFMGTGTFPYMAKKLGRHYIGIEQNRDYYNIAVKRLDKLNVNNKWF